MKVVILVGETRSRGKHLKDLVERFSGHDVSTFYGQESSLVEKYRAEDRLMILRDSSVVIRSVDDFMTEAEGIFERSDVILLGSSRDECQKYRKIRGTELPIKITTGCGRSQGMILNREALSLLARDYKISIESTLDVAIREGNLRAAVFSPNVVVYDTTLATTMSDYDRVNPCAIPSSRYEGPSKINVFFWMILVISLMSLAIASSY